MRATAFLSAALALLPAFARAAPSPIERALKPFSTFGPNLFYTPPAGTQTSYPRVVLLNQESDKPKNTLLATWQQPSSMSYFPIFRSTDGGESWSWFSNATDQVNGVGLTLQPFLYELPFAIGAYPKGTVLLAGNSISQNATHLDLYASPDKGRTWHFVSHMALGGPADTTDGVPAIWEPFLLAYEGRLIAYYSDQRDPKHGQSLVYQTSADLKSWGTVENAVAYSNYTSRPGMITVAPLPNGDWITTYEFAYVPKGPNYAAYYRIAKDPLSFQQATGYPIMTADGFQPDASPYVVWTPAGGPQGTIVVTAASNSTVFTHKQLGAPHIPWTVVQTPEPAGYSRCLQVMPSNQDILIMSAGAYGDTSTNVTVSVIDITRAH